MNRKTFSSTLLAGALAGALGLACTLPAQAQTQTQAQTYPTRSITLVVPFAAGGPTDVVARSRPAACPWARRCRARP